MNDSEEKKRAQQNFRRGLSHATTGNSRLVNNDPDVIQLSRGPRKQNRMGSGLIKRDSVMTEKISSIVGPLFFGGYFFGSFFGLFKGYKLSRAIKSRTIMKTKIINSVLKYGERSANLLGGSALLYMVVVKVSHFLFLEEEELISPYFTVGLSGFATGAVLRAGYGWRSWLLTGGLGLCGSLAVNAMHSRYNR